MIKEMCLLVIFACLGSCTDSSRQNHNNTAVDDPGVFASNLEMATELQRLADATNPMAAVHLNSKRAEFYRLELAQVSGPKRIPVRYNYAQELLAAGKTILAIEEFNGIKREIEGFGMGLEDQTKRVYDMLAVAYLRLAEEENCSAEHNAESCILPLQGQAIHAKREGSTGAIEVYRTILAQYPDDLQSRYLLNLAYMSLGEYPDGVPSNLLIKDMASFSKNPLLPKFKDVAIQSNSDIFGLSGGSCLEDFNNDGLLDIFASSYGLTDQIRFLINSGNGSFNDITEQAGLTGIVSGLNTLQADYNNDGFVDIIVLRGAWLGSEGEHPNSLLRNNGDNTFTDVTRSSGIYSLHPTQTAVWRDFDLDGWVDIFVGNESIGQQNHRSEFFHNNRDGTFTEQSALANLNIETYVKGCSSGDINNDGWPDLYVSVLTGPNLLFLNQGPGPNGVVRFKDISATSGTNNPFYSFPCWFWDYDQDGWEDIFAASYDLSGLKNMTEQVAAEMMNLPVSADLSKVYKNNGDLSFTDVTSELKLDKLMYAMGSNFGDLNNDGYDDFYIGNGAPDLRMIIPNRMFLSMAGDQFAEVSYDGGFAHIQKGHSVSFGDVDNDGDQDIYCVMGGAVEGDKYQNLLFNNPGSENNWIVLRPEGTTSNKKAIGARISVHGRDNDGNLLTRYQTVSTGGSFGGSSLQVEIGLSTMQLIDSVKVRWPNIARSTQVFTDLEVNGIYKLIEGSAEALTDPSPNFKFSPS